MLGIVALLLLSIIRFAVAESLVSTYCSNPPSHIISKRFADFNEEEMRRQSPESYVRAMDHLIANSPFKYLIDCRDIINADPRFKYKVHFLEKSEGAMMSVQRQRQFEGLEAKMFLQLSFNLKNSPHMILFTYIHELTHICQALRWATLQANFDMLEALPPSFVGGMGIYPGSMSCEDAKRPYSEIKADYHRHRKFGEVEGFYTMTKAFQYFTSIDSSLCQGGSEDLKRNLSEGYLEMEEMINKGYFAQDIIVKYHEGDDRKDEVANALFSSQDPHLVYPDNVRRPLLHPLLKEMILKAGMPIIEPSMSLKSSD